MHTELVTIAADEVGKPVNQADIEVSETYDFAHHYASFVGEEVGGTTHRSSKVITVIPLWNFPIAIPLGGIASALAVGSTVLLRLASLSRRYATLLAETCWWAGPPRDLVQYVVMGSCALGKKLVRDKRVGLVVPTGSMETVEIFHPWRSNLLLLVETSGKNVLIITPSTDLGLAAVDLVMSASEHAG